MEEFNSSEIISELKALIKDARNSQKKTKKKEVIKHNKSPYLVDMKRTLLSTDSIPVLSSEIGKRSESISTTSTITTTSTKKNRKRQIKDSSLQSSLKVDPEKAKVAALTLPYSERIQKIHAHLWLDEKLTKSTNKEKKDNFEYSPIGIIKAKDSFGKGSVAFEDSLVNPKTMDKFVKKYPRFCSFLDMNAETSSLTMRSDLWMARFMEECYDEAFLSCCTPVGNVERWRLRNGLDLGSMDAFPLVMQRFMKRKFSVLEVRQKLGLEFLFTLNYQMERSDMARYGALKEADLNLGTGGREMIFDGGRAQLFSLFLSEEYDLDFLAVFLRLRELLQKQMKHKFKDVVQSSIHPEEDSSRSDNKFLMSKSARVNRSHFTLEREKKDNNKSSTTNNTTLQLSSSQSQLSDSTTTSSRVSPIKKGLSRMVPVPLPPQWCFLEDGIMREALLVGFEIQLLPVICALVLPAKHWHQSNSSTEPITNGVQFEHAVAPETARQRFYLAKMVRELAALDNIVTVVEGGTMMPSVPAPQEARWDHWEYEAGLVGKKPLSKAQIRLQGAKRVKRVKFIPLYVLLRVVCMEWRKVPAFTKEKLMASNESEQSLRSLHDIYKDNCATVKHLEQQILDAKSQLVQAHGEFLQLQKSSRRLERRWNNNVASDDELWEFQLLRAQRNEAHLKEMEIEARLNHLKRSRKDLQLKIENLWVKATLETKSSNTELSPKNKQVRKSEWKKEIMELLAKVMQFNEEDYRVQHRLFLTEQRRVAMEAFKTKLAQLKDQTTEQKTILSGEAQVEKHKRDSALVIDVMSKIVVRNCLNEGVRRVALNLYLQRKRHELLLLYGDEEYRQKERQRIARERAEYLRKAHLVAIKYWAPIVSRRFVFSVMKVGRERAEEALFDPWASLDWSPSRWLPSFVLVQVESRFANASEKQRLKICRLLFHYIRRPFRLSRLEKSRLNRIKKWVWDQMLADLIEAKRVRRLIVQLQRTAKIFLFSRRALKHMDFLRQVEEKARRHYEGSLFEKRYNYFLKWRRVCTMSRKFNNCVFALKERRFMLTFFIWLDQYKKHKLARIRLNEEQMVACVKVQQFLRCCAARWELRRRKSRRIIGLALKVFKARKQYRDMLSYRRRLEDYSQRCRFQHRMMTLAHSIKRWKMMYNVKQGMCKLESAVRRDKLRRRVHKWKAVYEFVMRRWVKKARVVQSVVRMWLVHKNVLHYYRWRRGLVAFQGLSRRKPCMRQYEYDIFYYRAAKAIQKIARGFVVRTHLNAARVADIHYAAATNKYDRLKFYAEKYPDLIFELDFEGNTALHNAAFHAAKRTLKLLVKCGLDPNVLSGHGFTPMHMVIKSNSVNRDECFLYMLERGFSDEIKCPDGKSCLLLAAEQGRNVIVRHLLDEDHDPNLPDFNGLTCLQTACAQGNFAMAKDFVDEDAEVNQAGLAGAYPLHDVATSGNVDIVNMLISHGAYVNVVEAEFHQTPLMWACKHGEAEVAHHYLLHGAEIAAIDIQGRTAAHHAATSDRRDRQQRLYDVLREADADFDALDYEGNCPMHLAAELGSTVFASHVLLQGAYPSWQNQHGDQPAHIAARYNQLELLQLICKYDEHIGRVNYNHQTPLGVAKFHNSLECSAFLEDHYRMVETDGERNQLGEIWWDKELDAMVGDWEVSVDPQANRTYINTVTGEVRDSPPEVSASLVASTALKAQLPLRAKIRLVKEGAAITKHAYYIDYAAKEREVAEIAKDYVNATIIVKFARRKLAYMALKKAREQKRLMRIVTGFIARTLPKFKLWKKRVEDRTATKIQSAARGYIMRRSFFYGEPKSEYQMRKEYVAQFRLRYKLWALWKLYQRRLEFKSMQIAQNLPRTLHDWQLIVDQCRKPVRAVGMYEEYLYPNTHNIFFYRHALTGNCVFDKPKKMEWLDNQAAVEETQRRKFGATSREISLATKLQAFWRGHSVRRYGLVVEKAMEITMQTEKKYLEDPQKDVNLYNYAIHTLAAMQDLERARRVFLEALRRMQWKGPDNAFVIYGYCIFGLYARDESYEEVMILLQRAHRAEEERDTMLRKRRGEAPSPAIAAGTFRYGQVFEMASVGFFRHSAETKRNCMGWELYGLCRFLVFNDFKGAFDAYLEAFRFDPENRQLKENFDLMMGHFHGKDKSVQDAVVKERMRHHAQIDAEEEEIRRVYRVEAQERSNAATKIKEWYKECRGQRVFKSFIVAVKEKVKARKKAERPPSAFDRRNAIQF